MNAIIVNERKIENALDFTPCEFKKNFGVGKQPGTSLVNVFRLIHKTVKGYRNRGIDYPLVLTITVDAVEPVKGQLPFSDDTVKEIANIASELTSDGKGEIVIIGPSAIDSLQEKLKNLEADRNLEICPFSNTKSCTEKAIKNARKS